LSGASDERRRWRGVLALLPAVLALDAAGCGDLSDDELLGRQAVDQSARRLGRVYEAKGHWESDGTVVVDELILGRGGMRRRLRGPGGPERQAVPWEAVVGIEGECLVVRR
jgi:sporulation protein YlmC with PRC-barrel domain